MSILNRVSILTMFLLLTACASHKYTIMEPAKEPLTSFEVLEIAPFATALKDEDSIELSSLFAGRLFDEIQHHREKNVGDRIFNEITLSTNKIDGVLVMESTIISFEKGSRAKRYFFGFGSGKAYCTIQVIFRNKKSGAELARTNFDGELSGGVFGGDAEGTVDGVAKAFIDYMQEYMANSSHDIDFKTSPALTSERRAQDASPVEESQTRQSITAAQREQPAYQTVQPPSRSVQPSSQTVQPPSRSVQPSSQTAQGNQAANKPNYIVAPRPSRLRSVHARDKDDCELIKSITRNTGGTGDVSNYIKSAKSSALTEATSIGADSYFIVNAESTSFGASVTLEALRCN